MSGYLYFLGLLVVAFLGYVIRGFVGSYASEKAKNLATKEDIAQITHEIEQVKASFQTLTQLKTEYEQQRRNCLLAFYDSCIELLYERFAIDFGDLPFDNGKSLFTFQDSFYSLVASMMKKYQRIVIFFEHENDLRENAEKVLNEALSARQVLKKRLGAVKLAFMEEEAAIKSSDSNWRKEAAKAADDANKLYWDEMKPIIDTYTDLLREYLISVNIFLKNGGDS